MKGENCHQVKLHGVNPERHGGGVEHGDGQGDAGVGIQEAAQNQEHDYRCHHENDGAQVGLGDQVGQRLGQTGHGHELGKHAGAGQDQKQHGHVLHRVHDGAPDLPEGGALDEAHEEEHQTADRAGFRGAADAEEDAADDHHGHNCDGDQVLQGNQLFLPGEALLHPWEQGGLDDGRDHGKQREADRQCQTGGDGGHEQAADRVARQGAENDYQDTGRDKLADVAGGSDQAIGQIGIVAVPAHLRRSDLCEHGAGDQRGAVQRAEGGASQRGSHAQAAGNAAQPLGQRVVALCTDSDSGCQHAHQNKQRDDCIIKGCNSAVGLNADHGHRLGQVQAGDQPEKAHGSQRHRNVYSHQDQHDQGDHADQGQNDSAFHLAVTILFRVLRPFHTKRAQLILGGELGFDQDGVHLVWPGDSDGAVYRHERTLNSQQQPAQETAELSDEYIHRHGGHRLLFDQPGGPELVPRRFDHDNKQDCGQQVDEKAEDVLDPAVQPVVHGAKLHVLSLQQSVAHAGIGHPGHQHGNDLCRPLDRRIERIAHEHIAADEHHVKQHHPGGDPAEELHQELRLFIKRR